MSFFPAAWMFSWLLALLASSASLASAAADWKPFGAAEPDPCDQHMFDNLGWLQQYIEVGFFTDFRNHAWRYFATNETSYAFLWLNSIAYANLDFVREACPEAAQLALLLRAEERLPAREAEPPLLEYAALADRPKTAADQHRLLKWPLDLGLQRLQRQAAVMAVVEEYSVDVVMPYCAEPLDGLLSKSTGYAEDWLVSRPPFRHAKLILYRLVSCFEAAADTAATTSGEAALALLPERAVSAARLFGSLEIVPVNASPRAWEAARYLMHLSQRYNTLADFTIFLHPDVFEHVNPRTLRNVLQAIRVGTLRSSGGAGKWYEHLSLSHHYILRPSRARFASANCTDVDLGFQHLWHQLFGKGSVLASAGVETQKATELEDFGFYCCSQLMVHRDKVHEKPREWYQAIADGVAWEHCATSYMELLWHGVFHGGQLHEAKRQERTELPLFLRVDNFNEQTSDGLI